MNDIKNDQPKLEVSANWQTRCRGTNDNEYQIYLSFANPDSVLGRLKTYEEWLNS